MSQKIRRKNLKTKRRSVVQAWVSQLSMMQQTVLLTAIRGPDGVEKEHPAKGVLRWYRRCILLSAMDGKVLKTPDAPGGGSFTGPAAWKMEDIAIGYLKRCDEIPHHFFMHLMHAAQILGYKHPDVDTRAWWRVFYFHCVTALHLEPELEADMDARLGDNVDGWRAADARPVRMERRYQKLNHAGGKPLAYDASLRWPRVPDAIVEKLEPVSAMLRDALDRDNAEAAKHPPQWPGVE